MHLQVKIYLFGYFGLSSCKIHLDVLSEARGSNHSVKSPEAQIASKVQTTLHS